MRALVVALLLIWCAGMTAHRLPVWRSDETLWSDAHRQSPTLPRPLLNLGALALREGRIEAADAWWIRAEQTGRLTAPERQTLRQLRCYAALTDGTARRSVEDCS